MHFLKKIKVSVDYFGLSIILIIEDRLKRKAKIEGQIQAEAKIN